MNLIRPPIFIYLFFSVLYMTAALADGKQNMVLRSPDFVHQGGIPPKFTCEDDDSSPALNWSGVPSSAKSLVLIVDDPDTPDPAKPQITWTHWLLYNIPPTVTELPQSITAATLPKGTLQGINDWKRTGYGGPCPPFGRHRYFHKLYALDIELPDLQQPSKDQLEKAMTGHVIKKAELIGTYKQQ